QRPSFAPVAAKPSAVSSEHERKQIKVLQLINAYRFRGHQHAKLDPLGLMVREQVPDLDLSFHGLTAADLDTEFHTGSLCFGGADTMTLGDIIKGLEETYCGTVGAEYMHIVNTEEKRWRSEEHTSELLSRENLVCRLLLEKKNK